MNEPGRSSGRIGQLGSVTVHLDSCLFSMADSPGLRFHDYEPLLPECIDRLQVRAIGLFSDDRKPRWLDHVKAAAAL